MWAWIWRRRALGDRLTRARAALEAGEQQAAEVAFYKTVRGRLERAVSRDAREAYA
jgi:hypothetical protein